MSDNTVIKKLVDSMDIEKSLAFSKSDIIIRQLKVKTSVSSLLEIRQSLDAETGEVTVHFEKEFYKFYLESINETFLFSKLNNTEIA